MLDLFCPPTIRVPPASLVHRLKDEPRKKREKKKSVAGQSPRYEYDRKYYTAKREERLLQMKANYQAKKNEYIARNKKWQQENPEAWKLIQRNSKRRKWATSKARTESASSEERIIPEGLRDSYMTTEHLEEGKSAW